MALNKLIEVLKRSNGGAIAVSGGVDSMTLAYVANRYAEGYQIFHAISPAVPKAATARIKHYAKTENWRLNLINAQEIHDKNYNTNPVNRCFYCKTNLYTTIKNYTDLPIFSGTNVDDLSDYRPGLQAAERNNVCHPYVLANIDKEAIRKIAYDFGLNELSVLPASPCLSSRIETGIAIDSTKLGIVEKVESYIEERLNPKTWRCRVRPSGLHIELDDPTISQISEHDKEQIINSIQQLISPFKYSIKIDNYIRGSAFIGRFK